MVCGMGVSHIVAQRTFEMDMGVVVVCGTRTERDRDRMGQDTTRTERRISVAISTSWGTWKEGLVYPSNLGRVGYLLATAWVSVDLPVRIWRT